MDSSPMPKKRNKFPKRSRSSGSFKRAENIRPPRECVLVVCEGSKTEPNYFKSLRKNLKLTSVQVEIEGEGAAPITVVDRALEMREVRRKEVKKAKKQGDWSSKLQYDSVWCVFDVEKVADNTSFYRAVDKALANKLQLGISNPAFEYWYLLHFRYTTRQFSDAEEIIGELKKYIPCYTKTKDVLRDLLEHTEKAITHAQRILAENPDQENPYPNPSTTICKLVKKMIDMSNISPTV
jgi:hypothetical protein